MKLNKDDHAHTTSHIYLVLTVKAELGYTMGLGKDIFNSFRQLLQIVVIVCFKHKSK